MPAIVCEARYGEKYWSRSSEQWLDDSPEYIYYVFGNNVFTQQIALYVAEKYNIPIITAIGDDFYFNDQKSFSPTYHLYRTIFKKLTREVFSRENSSAVYVSDKIKEKYNSEFGLDGETIYLSSTIDRNHSPQ